MNWVYAPWNLYSMLTQNFIWKSAVFFYSLITCGIHRERQIRFFLFRRKKGNALISFLFSLFILTHTLYVWSSRTQEITFIQRLQTTPFWLIGDKFTLEIKRRCHKNDYDNDETKNEETNQESELQQKSLKVLWARKNVDTIKGWYLH